MKPISKTVCDDSVGGGPYTSVWRLLRGDHQKIVCCLLLSSPPLNIQHQFILSFLFFFIFYGSSYVHINMHLHLQSYFSCHCCCCYTFSISLSKERRKRNAHTHTHTSSPIYSSTSASQCLPSPYSYNHASCFYHPSGTSPGIPIQMPAGTLS